MQMLRSFGSWTVVVSSGPSVASTRRGRARKLAAPASKAVVRKWRRVCIVGIGKPPPIHYSRLQLAFELVQEPPISALGDDLLRGRLDEPGVAHAQRVEPDRILR